MHNAIVKSLNLHLYFSCEGFHNIWGNGNRKSERPVVATQDQRVIRTLTGRYMAHCRALSCQFVLEHYLLCRYHNLFSSYLSTCWTIALFGKQKSVQPYFFSLYCSHKTQAVNNKKLFVCLGALRRVHSLVQEAQMEQVYTVWGSADFYWANAQSTATIGNKSTSRTTWGGQCENMSISCSQNYLNSIVL